MLSGSADLGLFSALKYCGTSASFAFSLSSSGTIPVHWEILKMPGCTWLYTLKFRVYSYELKYHQPSRVAFLNCIYALNFLGFVNFYLRPNGFWAFTTRFGLGYNSRGALPFSVSSDIPATGYWAWLDNQPTFSDVLLMSDPRASTIALLRFWCSKKDISVSVPRSGPGRVRATTITQLLSGALTCVLLFWHLGLNASAFSLDSDASLLPCPHSEHHSYPPLAAMSVMWLNSLHVDTALTLIFGSV